MSLSVRLAATSGSVYIKGGYPKPLPVGMYVPESVVSCLLSWSFEV